MSKTLTGPVKLYTTSWCPFCIRALRLLAEREVPHENVDLTDDPVELQKVKSAHSYNTVPLILANGELLGGYSELAALDSETGLENLKSS